MNSNIYTPPPIKSIRQQNGEKNKDWIKDLSASHLDKYEYHRASSGLHSLSNLILLTNQSNAGISDSSFTTKKTKYKSDNSPLARVYIAGKHNKWDFQEMEKHADDLLKLFEKIWPEF